MPQQTNNKERASRQTHTQETTTKLTKENSTEKKWKPAVCDHVKKRKKTSEAESFRHMKIKKKYPTHLKMAM
jgi:hypothetical protein